MHNGILDKDLWCHPIHGLQALFPENYEVLEATRQGGAGSALGLLLLNWIDITLSSHRITRLMLIAFFPAWIIFCFTINMLGALWDGLDRTESFYHNTPLVLRKKNRLDPGLETMSIQHTAYSVTAADLVQDEALILDLWHQSYPSPMHARYDWMYRNNPQGNPYCLLLRTPDHQAVGATCVVRRQLRFGDKSLAAGQAIDLVINRAHRSGGPAMHLQRSLAAGLAENGIDLLYSTPVPGAELIARRVGYKVLGSLQRWTKPLRFERELQNRVNIPFAPLRKFAGALLDGAHQLWSGEISFREKRWTTSIETTFDQRFDDLWSKANCQFDIVGERSAAYLSWRFGSKALDSYRVFCLADARQELAGYVVFSRHNGIVKIADLLAANPDQLRQLLLGFSREMRRAGVESLMFLYVGSDIIARGLKATGFFRRPEKSNMLLYLHEAGIPSATELLDPSRWYLTDADRDV